ncbi:MAG TPA: Bax inhibitor-1/YccA family protein [Candidatus Bathyarchaeia archaeon]|nr:Bax inhibitor-1/YccA family protein [Candidatus Bathyarchaeia archaeon]
MFRSSNPTLRESMLAQERSFAEGQPMTVQGAVNKSFVLLGLIVLSAFWVWSKALQPAPLAAYGAAAAANSTAMGYAMAGGFIGFIFAMITIFKKEWANRTAPIYALCEGAFLGGVSASFELQYQGIVVQAVALTLGVMFCMLAIYKSGMIKVDQKFMLGLAAATGAVCLVYLVNFVLMFFNRGVPLVYSSGPIGIGFSVIVVGIAAFNLVVDFFMIEECARMRCGKHMEWYTAFGLMVTLVWLYLEILRLLVKLNNRR